MLWWLSRHGNDITECYEFLNIPAGSSLLDLLASFTNASLSTSFFFSHLWNIKMYHNWKQAFNTHVGRKETRYENWVRGVEIWGGVNFDQLPPKGLMVYGIVLKITWGWFTGQNFYFTKFAPFLVAIFLIDFSNYKQTILMVSKPPYSML